MRALPVSDPGTPDLRSPWRFLLWLLVRQKAGVALGITWGCAWMIAQALVPAVIGAAVDALAARRAVAFGTDCLAVLGLGSLTAVTGVLRHRCVVGNFLNAAYRIIQLITDQAARLGDTLSRLLSTGEVISVGTADVEAVGSAIDVTGRGSGAIAALIAVSVLLLAKSLPLGLIVLIGGPAMTALVGVLLRPLHQRQQSYRELQGQLAGRAADIVSGLRVLRGIGGEPAFSERYRRQSQQLRHTGVSVARTESVLSGAEILLPGMFVTTATWIAAHYALHKFITPGQLVTFYAYAAFLALPLATLTEAADQIVRGHVGAGRVIAILALAPDVTDPARPRPAPAAGASLHDPASGLTAAPGELVGIAADSPDEGVALAERLGRYAPPPGTGRAACRGPELGGVPLADLPVAAVRRRILVATSDAHLFAGRLDQQLAGARAAGRAQVPPAGRPGGTGLGTTAIMTAISAASAHDAIDAVPGGLAGHLAARGRALSGGQAQRLRLARALLADPDILVLIEPTSAVDAHTEARIARSLREIRRGRTTLVVTNSPLLLDQADRVVYLSGGSVAAHGTHRELLSASPGYAGAVTRGAEP
jgi:ABC-type multidrug transport system fused ATPase/permease subunit